MPVVGNAYQGDNQNVAGEAIGQLLNMVLQGVNKNVNTNTQEQRDMAYRKSAAKLMGVAPEDLGYFTRAETQDLLKEKIKPTEWKPKTKEEALTLKAAEYEGKVKFEKEKNKIKMGEEDPIMNDPNATDGSVMPGTAPATLAAKPKLDIGTILQKVLGMGGQALSGAGKFAQAITPLDPVGAITRMIMPQGAGNSPVPTAVPTAQPLPGEAAPAATVPMADPIAVRIKEAVAQGMDPKELAQMLVEKGIDPAKYGL